MSTIFLRFPDAAAFWSLMPAQERDDGLPTLPAGVEAISIIGTISQGGEWDEEGAVITPPTLLPGFHVNALGATPESWAPYVVTPTSPQRVFGS